MITLATLRKAVAARLGDPGGTLWTNDEIDGYLETAYLVLAQSMGVFWDQLYAENLPAGFSYTATWELDELQTRPGLFDYGRANVTAAFELDQDARLRLGQGNHTSPFEATSGWLALAGASVAIPATVEMPRALTALDRLTYDHRGIDALQARSMSKLDARYERTTGEVYGYIWQKDGIRTLRKVRVPGVQASTVTVTGSWGLLRNPTDLSTDTVTGTWGIVRRIPGHHPIGTELFGLPRRPYLDGTNVKVEHFRQGRSIATSQAICELPIRYALYLRDAAMAGCLGRYGPGQDQKLAAHFTERWSRGVARIARRITLVDTERTMVMGGVTDRTLGSKPPRPSLPYHYGSRVR